MVSSRENSSFIAKKSFLTLRLQASIFLFQLRQLLYSGRIKHASTDTLIKPLAIYSEHMCALPIVDVLHTLYSSIGNEVISSGTESDFIVYCLSVFQSTSPAYHLLHGHLEWRWFHLTLKLRIEQDRSALCQLIAAKTLRDTDFEIKLKLFIYDLIVISAAKFNKVNTTFICIWMNFALIQLVFDFSFTFRNCRPKRHSCASVSRKCGWWFNCLSKNYTRMAANWIHFGFTSAMHWNNSAIEKVSVGEVIAVPRYW